MHMIQLSQCSNFYDNAIGVRKMNACITIATNLFLGKVPIGLMKYNIDYLSITLISLY